jgi:hypothetical protein
MYDDDLYDIPQPPWSGRVQGGCSDRRPLWSLLGLGITTALFNGSVLLLEYLFQLSCASGDTIFCPSDTLSVVVGILRALGVLTVGMTVSAVAILLHR